MITGDTLRAAGSADRRTRRSARRDIARAMADGDYAPDTGIAPYGRDRARRLAQLLFLASYYRWNVAHMPRDSFRGAFAYAISPLSGRAWRHDATLSAVGADIERAQSLGACRAVLAELARSAPFRLPE